MWIGCADARVPANEIMGEATGSVFVVRNVANMVVNTDFNLMGALQFAVDYLKIPHIIVCGHYDCGGIRASMEAKDHVPPLENWLRNVRDVYRLHREELDMIEDPEQRHRRLVELNVVEQCINLFKTGVVQRRRVATYKEGQPYTTPRIHACVFDPTTGSLKRLDYDFYQCIDELRDIYDLYSIDDEERRLMRKKGTQHSFSFVANSLTHNVNLGKVIGL
jgi:carbonic anhydrase